MVTSVAYSIFDELCIQSQRMCEECRIFIEEAGVHLDFGGHNKDTV